MGGNQFDLQSGAGTADFTCVSAAEAPRQKAQWRQKLKIELKVIDERLHQWGLPRYQSDLAAAVDLHACIDEPLLLAPGAAAMLVSTGFALNMADSEVAAVIAPRPGLGHKKGLVLGNTIGVIDADYQGTVLVSAWNRNASGEAIVIEPGERIAQLLFVPIIRPEFTVVDEFSVATERGADGFGSTGSKDTAASG